MTQIRWLDWSKAVFDASRSSRKPVLLYISAPWCHSCAMMDRTTYSDPNVATKIDTSFIPVRVDSDRRPDVFSRFNMGGWPTTVFLTSRGKIMAGGTFIPPDKMRSILDELLSFYSENYRIVESDEFGGIERPGKPAGDGRGELSWRFVEDVIDTLEDAYDHRYGGFERSPKFIRPYALLLLLNAGAWGFEDKPAIATHTLKAIYAGDIHDKIEEGFFRYASRRDWSSPAYEKILGDNALLMECYLTAHAMFETREFSTAAREISEFLDNVLWLPARGFYGGSQQADEEYFSENASGRRRRSVPPVDTTVYTDQNALAAVSLCHLWWETHNDHYAERALAIVNGLSEHMLLPSGACYHYWAVGAKPDLPGYLKDEATIALALAEVFQLTGDSKYADALRSVLGYCEKHLAAPNGGFFDLPREIAESHSIERLVPEEDNAMLARAYLAAWGVTMEDSYLDKARHLVEAVTPPGQGRMDDALLALAAGAVLQPVSVLAGSKSDLAFAAKRKFPAVPLGIDKTLENTAVIRTADRRYDPVITQHDVQRMISEALNPRGFAPRTVGTYKGEFIPPYIH